MEAVLLDIAPGAAHIDRSGTAAHLPGKHHRFVYVAGVVGVADIPADTVDNRVQQVAGMAVVAAHMDTAESVDNRASAVDRVGFAHSSYS